MPSLRPAALASILVAALSASAASQTPTYHAEFLGSAVYVSAMNDDGLVVGQGTVGIYPRAWVAGPGKPITYLPLPMGFLSSTPTDINDAGVIVGKISPYSTTNTIPQPARWDPDGAGGWTVTRLDTLPGDNRGTADAINDLGDIVGTSSYQSSIKTVLYTASGPVMLPGLGHLPPRSLNDSRVYVSGSSRVDLDTLAVENLGVPAGFTGVEGWVINDAGQVLADLTLDGGAGCTEQVGLYADGPGWQALATCGGEASAHDLNDLGDVLLKVDYDPQVLFAGGGLHRVEDLIVADSGKWTLPGMIYGIAMNDARQMALYATNGGQSGIILITPDTDVICQADLGFAGPGTLDLDLCGGDLSSGTTADLSLTGALPNVGAWLFAGLSQLPVPFKGGTLVPVPWALLLPLPVDASGHGGIAGVPGGIGPLTVYVQAVQADAAQPHGWAISNALRVDFLP